MMNRRLLALFVALLGAGCAGGPSDTTAEGSAGSAVSAGAPGAPHVGIIYGTVVDSDNQAMPTVALDFIFAEGVASVVTDQYGSYAVRPARLGCHGSINAYFGVLPGRGQAPIEVDGLPFCASDNAQRFDVQLRFDDQGVPSIHQN